MPPKSLLLGCRCGDAECHPLYTEIEFWRDTVVWHEFDGSHPDWRYDRLGPFVFDRAQYEEQLAKLR